MRVSRAREMFAEGTLEFMLHSLDFRLGAKRS